MGGGGGGGGGAHTLLLFNQAKFEHLQLSDIVSREGES